jgi:hypothetical protein
VARSGNTVQQKTATAHNKQCEASSVARGLFTADTQMMDRKTNEGQASYCEFSGKAFDVGAVCEA